MIYDLAVEYNEACNEYLDAIKGQAKIDSNLDAMISETAEKIYKEDHARTKSSAHLSFSLIPAEYEKAAYKVYALYLLNFSTKAIEMGKINLSKDPISIQADIIKYVKNNLHNVDFTGEYNGYEVHITGGSYFSSGFGSITIQRKNKNGYLTGRQYQGVFCSTQDAVMSDMSDFIENWRDVTTDALKQGIMSVFSELDQVTGFSDFVSSDIKSCLKKFKKAMTVYGYGKKVISNLQNCKKGYDAIKNIIADNSPTQERLLNALSNAKEIHNTFNKFDFSNEDITNYGVEQAMEKLKKAKQDLEDGLYNYVYNIHGEENKNWWQKTWGGFKSIFACPVDFTVYDENGSVLGYVDNGVTYDNGEIHIETRGDVKTLYVPKDKKVKIVMKGTDEGSFNYVLEKTENGKPVERLNYYDIDLTNEAEFTQEISDQIITNKLDAVPIVAENGNIFADEYYDAEDLSAYVTVNAYSIGEGQVIGADDYPMGDPVTLVALSADDEHEFIGWYDKEDNFISGSSTYRFTARYNTSLYAKFDKKRYIDYAIDTEISEKYEGKLGIEVCKSDINDDTLDDIVLYCDDSIKDLSGLHYICYDENNIISGNENMTFSKLSENSYIDCGINLKTYSRIEILDNAGEIMAILTKTDLIKDIQYQINSITRDTDSVIISLSADASAEDGILVVALYDKNQRLKEVKYEEVTLASTAVTADITVSDTDTVSAFVWDSCEEMTPLSNAINF